jgi:serine/threonine-protein kinase HipA
VKVYGIDVALGHDNDAVYKASHRLAQRMAREVGINACEARIMNDAQHFPIALVRRFDRTRADRSARVPFISALTFLGLEGGNPVGTYEDIAMQMRAHAHDARAQMSELYRRKV